MKKIKIALMGPYPAQVCLCREQLRPSRRALRPHPAPWIKVLCEGFSGLADVEAALFVHSRDVSSIQSGTVGNARAFFIPKYEPGHLDPVQGDFTARLQLRPHIERFNPDVILGFGTESMYGLLPSRFRRPCALFIQGIVEKIPLEAYGVPHWKHPFLRYAERCAIHRTSAVIAENQFAADWARSINPDVRVAVIPHPVASEFLQIRSDYRPRVLFIGVLNSNKRPDMVARAFAGICRQHPNAELVIVGGNGNVAGALREFVARQGLGDCIRVAGSLSRSEVMQELSQARCLVLASRMDTSPNVVTEAHAAGLPVVATRVGGIPEMVDSGTDGFLVDTDDEQAMAAHLNTLLSDQALAERMGSAGRQKVMNLNASDGVVEQYMQFLEQVVSGGAVQ